MIIENNNMKSDWIELDKWDEDTVCDSLRVWSTTGRIWKAAIFAVDGIAMINVEFEVGSITYEIANAHSEHPVEYLSIGQVRGKDSDDGLNLVIV